MLQKLLLIVLPVTLLFGALEAIQRVRYALRQNDARWLAYGVARSDAAVASIAMTHDIDEQLARVDARHRYVACVGGSSTRGVYNDPEHRFPFLLNRLIDARARPDRFVVLNLGRGAAASVDYATVVDQLLGAVTPAVVVFYAGYNDVFSAPLDGTVRTVAAHALVQLERFSLLALTAHEKLLVSRLNRPGDLLTLARLREIEDGLRRNVTAQVERLRQRGVAVVIVPEVVMAKRFGGPTRNYERYGESYRGIPAALRAVAEAHGAEYLSVQDDFEREDFRANFADPVHLTDRGNALLARLLLERSRALRALVDAP